MHSPEHYKHDCSASRLRFLLAQNGLNKTLHNGLSKHKLASGKAILCLIFWSLHSPEVKILALQFSHIALANKVIEPQHDLEAERRVMMTTVVQSKGLVTAHQFGFPEPGCLQLLQLSLSGTTVPTAGEDSDREKIQGFQQHTMK